ncbi:hypothetical protein HYALB_00009095 [Hymenoscyphus albidus]|uniref:O-methyltransferase C-terminal domain-containing protein n=1 Tax=Hymenoscyphus albidus TaxID=595503 RepID=A0A9N9Q7K7_9HELO|nr:hypothetical protein HYALB_00009095 [Hymenoscyphus albidus]
MADAHISQPEIAPLVEDVEKAGADFHAAKDGDIHTARRNLQHATRKLLQSLEEPNGEVWPRSFQVNVSAAVEVISQLELWEKFEGGKAVALDGMVESTKADKIVLSEYIQTSYRIPGTYSLLVRVFRQLTAANIFTESAGPNFTITPLGKPYLHPDHRAFSNFMFYDLIPAIMAMPRTLEEHQYKAPSKETGTPFKWAHGEELWTWLGSHPDRAANMVAGMRSHAPLNAYPWAIELEKMGSKAEDIAVVDVAGGKGHTMEEVRERNPNIKGRFIVQDLSSTFKAMSAPPVGIELMTYDIFTPQPVKNALIYHYRHIIHNWSDGDCITFLGQIVPLLREQLRSKLLLVDVVLPDMNSTMQQAIMDVSMFPMGGMERTESQWKELLAKVGLSIEKIWRGSEPEACVECRLL